MKITLTILSILFFLFLIGIFIYENRKKYSILDKVNIVTWSWNLTSKKFKVSKNIENFCGLSHKIFNKELAYWDEIVFFEDIPRIKALYQDIMIGKITRIEFRLICPKNNPTWVEARIIRFINSRGKVYRLGGVLINIAERKELEKQIKNMAYQDCLTQLPNRSKLNEYLENALLMAELRETNIVLVFIDLDNFKDVNDQYGHLVGDLLLQSVGKRLQDSIRKKDFLARLGGDEFILVLEDVHKKDVDSVLGRINKCFSHSFNIEGIEIKIGLSLGISYYPEDGRDIKTLIYKADKAMYQHKKLF